MSYRLSHYELAQGRTGCSREWRFAPAFMPQGRILALLQVLKTSVNGMLKRVQITYEFCIDVPNGSNKEVLEIFNSMHTMAIDEDRCGIVSGPFVSDIKSSLDFEESTLEEVPLGSFDYTLRERLERGE